MYCSEECSTTARQRCCTITSSPCISVFLRIKCPLALLPSKTPIQTLCTIFCITPPPRALDARLDPVCYAIHLCHRSNGCFSAICSTDFSTPCMQNLAAGCWPRIFNCHCSFSRIFLTPASLTVLFETAYSSKTASFVEHTYYNWSRSCLHSAASLSVSSSSYRRKESFGLCLSSRH